MRRSTHTLASNKVVTEWTLPKMIIKAREEERIKKSQKAEFEKMKLLMQSQMDSKWIIL